MGTFYQFLILVAPHLPNIMLRQILHDISFKLQKFPLQLESITMHTLPSRVKVRKHCPDSTL